MTNGEKIIDKLITDFDNNKFSIAFLPYKYAMWDSMETVYDAAVNRGLSTHLMPIPYMTRGDGVWHDEATLFGKNIEDCNLLKEFEPDVVVIHNPYDGRNRVTSVQPDFYSDKIKALGCKLVYLAYCGSCWGEHFILQRGVKLADYIFTDTAAEKQHYIDVWAARNVDKSKNVFCVGGLPKYEAVNKRRNYPECFQRDNKRIVLICGGLTSFIDYPNERLQKWKDAIIKHSEGDDISVIFRPHPLMSDMVNAMFPQYRLKYDAFLREIEQYCIVDTSQNFQSAMALADYLISDPSSVVEVWKRTGKEYEVM